MGLPVIVTNYSGKVIFPTLHSSHQKTLKTNFKLTYQIITFYGIKKPRQQFLPQTLNVFKSFPLLKKPPCVPVTRLEPKLPRVHLAKIKRQRRKRAAISGLAPVGWEPVSFGRFVAGGVGVSVASGCVARDP